LCDGLSTQEAGKKIDAFQPQSPALAWTRTASNLNPGHLKLMQPFVPLMALSCSPTVQSINFQGC